MPPTDLDMHINLRYCLWRCMRCFWGKALHSRLPLNVILIHLDWEIHFLLSIKVPLSSHGIAISLYLQQPQEELERFSVLFKSGTLSSEMDCVAWAEHSRCHLEMRRTCRKIRGGGWRDWCLCRKGGWGAEASGVILRWEDMKSNPEVMILLASALIMNIVSHKDWLNAWGTQHLLKNHTWNLSRSPSRFCLVITCCGRIWGFINSLNRIYLSREQLL